VEPVDQFLENPELVFWLFIENPETSRSVSGIPAELGSRNRSAAGAYKQ